MISLFIFAAGFELDSPPYHRFRKHWLGTREVIFHLRIPSFHLVPDDPSCEAHETERPLCLSRHEPRPVPRLVRSVCQVECFVVADFWITQKDGAFASVGRENLQTQSRTASMPRLVSRRPPMEETVVFFHSPNAQLGIFPVRR